MQGRKGNGPPGDIMRATADGEAVVTVDDVIVLEKQVGAARRKACIQ